MVSILEIFLLNEIHLFHRLTVVWWLNLVVTLAPLGRRNASWSIVPIRLVCEHIFEGIFSFTNWSKRVQPTVSGTIPRQVCLGYLRKVAQPETGNEQVSSILPQSLLRFLPLGCSLEFLLWFALVMDYKLWNETNSFTPKLLLTKVFITATDTKSEQVVTVFSCENYFLFLEDQ